MIHYNNDNNAYCSAVNAQISETREHDNQYKSVLVGEEYTRNLHCRGSNQYVNKHVNIWCAAACIFKCICRYLYRSTNTFKYTSCCAPNVYMFVYILIGAPIVPLTVLH